MWHQAPFGNAVEERLTHHAYDACAIADFHQHAIGDREDGTRLFAGETTPRRDLPVF